MWPWKAALEGIERKLERIDEKLEKADGRLDSIDKTLVRHDENLKQHMKRTELAEKAIETLHKDNIPIKTHINRVDGALRAVGFIAMVGGMIYTFIRIFG